MAGGSTAPSFQGERLGRAGCVSPHLYLRSAHTWAPDETWESSVRVPYTAVVRDGSSCQRWRHSPSVCARGRHFRSRASVFQADSRGGARAGGDPGELPAGWACAPFLES